MSQNDDATDGGGLLGLSVERATEQVAPTVADDAETVRKTLLGISDDGTVTRAAVEDALAEVSKVVATPETRIEVAERALSDARETAAPVGDTDLVGSRLEAFEAELSALEERVEALGTRLSGVVERAGDSGELYVVARSIRQLRADATDAQNAADALATEVREFKRRLEDPGVWAEELQEDVDALEGSFEELQTVVDTLRDAESNGAEDGNPALAWADAALQYRVRELLVKDVEAELEVVEKLADRNGDDDPGDGVRRRLRELETLQTDVDNGLNEAFDAAWDRHYGETVAWFNRTLEEFEPPVPWGELQDELERHRERLQDPGNRQ